jgi:hypothetical protein
MDATDCRLKIIFYNILPNVQIDPISSSIKHCHTIQETLDSVNQYKNVDYEVCVVCQQQDVNQLVIPILNGRIDTIYILDEHAVNIRNNNRRKAASNEKYLQILIILGAAKYILGVALEPKGEEVDGITTALLHTVCRLLDLAQNLYNQNQNN